MFKVGDIVIYDPPYHVSSLKWNARRGDKFVVVRGRGEGSKCITVTELMFGDLRRRDVPPVNRYLLREEAFHHTEHMIVWEV
jgi:hypothetical protein